MDEKELGVDLNRYGRFALDLDRNVMDFVLVDTYCEGAEIDHLDWDELVKVAVERDNKAALELKETFEEEID